MQMNPSLAVYLGMKRASINFATSVPCVNLDEGLIWVVEVKRRRRTRPASCIYRPLDGICQAPRYPSVNLFSD